MGFGGRRNHPGSNGEEQNIDREKKLEEREREVREEKADDADTRSWRIFVLVVVVGGCFKVGCRCQSAPSRKTHNHPSAAAGESRAPS